MRLHPPALAFLVLACAPLNAHAIAPFFTQPFDHATTNSTEAADLDGDGLTDLVQSTHATVAVRMAGTGRNFGAPQSANFLAPVDRVRVGDFDGDGDQDLAGLHIEAVELLTHAGGCAYGAPATLPMPVGYYGRCLATGDLDNDGRNDIVVIATETGGPDAVLVVFRATASGFAAPVMRPTAPSFDGFRIDLVVADVDGDPSPDVVFGGSSDGIAVHLGNGDGTLRDPLLVAGATFVNDVEVADLDGDGYADLVVSFDAGVQTLRRYPGNGDGTFGAAQVLWTGPNVAAAAVADVDGGGDPDVVFSVFPFGPGVAMLRGEDAFAVAAVRTLIKASPGRPVRLGDFDADGRVDAFVGGPHGIYWGDPDGTPGNWAATGVIGGLPQTIEVLDVSGDGIPDLVTSTSTTSLAVERGHGDGTFEPPVMFGPSSASLMGLGDVNGDTHPDAVLTAVASGQFVIHVMFGSGTPSCFSGEQVTPLGVSGGGFSGINGLAVEDVNLDGREDVVVAGIQGGLTGPGPPFLRSYLGVTSGPLVPAHDAVVAFAKPALADMDGDDVPDLIGVSGASLEVRAGVGDGTFGAPATFAHPAGIFSFTPGRVDAGSERDVAIVSDDQTLGIALGNGDGTLQPIATVPGPGGWWFATLADVDGDGDTDAISGEPTSGDPGRIQVLLGDGAGGFPESFALSSGAGSLAPVRVADLNDDGRPDLVRMIYSNFGGSALHFSTLSPTTGVPPGGPAAGIALAAASPQRATGGLQVRFALPDGAPAQLEAFDVSGRRLAKMSVGTLGTGTHTVTLGAAHAPGVVFVRLTRGAARVTQRIATTR